MPDLFHLPDFSRVATLSSEEMLATEEMPGHRSKAALFNHLGNIITLGNSYFAMRHGLSESNEMHVTGSDPQFAVSAFDLVPEGCEQVRKAAREPVFRRTFNEDTILVCSDFLRAVHTAEIVRDEIHCREPLRVEWLRERFFGEFDLFDHETFFHIIHRADVSDPFSSVCGCESAACLGERLSRGILELESAMSGKRLLLITHHDALQMLDVIFSFRSPGNYAGTPEEPLPYVENCEIRPLKLVALPQSP